MNRLWKSIYAAAILLGLVMDLLGVLALLGLADVSIIPNININWPLIMIFVGTALIGFGLSWFGFGAWQNRPAARFSCEYDGAKSLLGDLYSHYGATDNQFHGFRANMKNKYKVPCPDTLDSKIWISFLQELIPLIEIGAVRKARKIIDHIEETEDEIPF